MVLRVSGKDIKDGLKTVRLLGINKHSFEDHPYGHWQTPAGGVIYNTWDPAVIQANLDAMKNWGINTVRMYSTAQFWIDNTEGHRERVKELASWMNARGMYLIYSFWHVTPTSPSPALPYPPYSQPGDEQVITSEADFINMWGSIATELKDYRNVLFELWNEPTGSGFDWSVARDSWFVATQSCIDIIRASGAANLIIVQWDWGIGVNLNYPDGAKMDWVELYPLNDTSGNLVYSTHNYRGNIHRTEPVRVNSYEYDDLKLGYELCLVDYVHNTLNKPVIIGEIGPNMWQTGDELIHELEFYANSLTIFNEWGVSYVGFWWWPTWSFAHLTPGSNYQPNEAGQILIDKIAEVVPLEPSIPSWILLAIPIGLFVLLMRRRR